MIIAVFHKKLIWPPVRALLKLKRHLLDFTLWTTVLKETTVIDRWRHMCFYWKRRWKQMWRHLSIAVAALKTVVQRVRSNRWRFNFERAGRGGQINFLWKMAMIISITKASILIIWPFPRGLLLTYPLSPPLIGVQLLLGQTVYGSLWK